MAAKSLLRLASVFGLSLVLGACVAGRASCDDVEASGELRVEQVASEGAAAGEADLEDVEYAMAVATNGRVIAVAYNKGRVALLDVESGEELRELALGLGSEPWRLAFSPDGQRLAGFGHPGGLRLWKMGVDASVGQIWGTGLQESFEVGEEWPYAFGAGLLWSPDGERFVVFENEGQLSLWTSDAELVTAWSVETTFYRDRQVAWSRDGSQLYCADGEQVLFRDAGTGELLLETEGVTQITCPKDVQTLAVHPKENWIATGHLDCELMIWDLDTGRLLQRAQHEDETFPEPEDGVVSIEWTDSGQRLAISISDGCTVFELDPVDLTKTWSSGFLGAHFFEAMPVEWAPDGEHLWFAFDCGGGGLYCVDPSPGVKATDNGEGLVPVFGDDFAVTISAGDVRVFELDGTLRW